MYGDFIYQSRLSHVSFAVTTNFSAAVYSSNPIGLQSNTLINLIIQLINNHSYIFLISFITSNVLKINLLIKRKIKRNL